MAKVRYLTKSRFKTGYVCPRKLVYLDDPAYGSNLQDNEFLEALAQGGFQVGALAQLYYPGGTLVDTLDADQAVAQTEALLSHPKAIIYEGALREGNRLVRVDVLVKDGKRVKLIEVKSSSYDSRDKEFSFYNQTRLKGKKPQKVVLKEWESYLVDVAYQLWVARRAYPKLEFEPTLMFADKAKPADRDGLNQLFWVERDQNGRVRIRTPENLKPEDVGPPILIEVPVADEVDTLHQAQYVGERSFEELALYLSQVCAQEEVPKPRTCALCKNCEFRIPDSEIEAGKKSGFRDCWTLDRKWTEKDFNQPHLFELWNFRRAQEFLDQGITSLNHIRKKHLDPQPRSGKTGLSATERQWLQVELARKTKLAMYLDRKAMRDLFKTWKYPFHLIDFETTRVAIPFNQGRKPYEQLAFQFSHHTLDGQGTLAHAGQFLSFERGKFPNFDFVRALKKQLQDDEGSLFCYSHHENSVLRDIRAQLEASQEPDRYELINWLTTVTTGGLRQFIDLFPVLKAFFIHRLLGGSNSLKRVLPTILAISPEIQAKYSKPVPSLNFGQKIWLTLDAKGQVLDPYAQLPPIDPSLPAPNQDADDEDSGAESIRSGGPAMMAYFRIQFEQVPAAEREQIRQALLRYCELDTVAMAILLEFFRIESKKKEADLASE